MGAALTGLAASDGTPVGLARSDGTPVLGASGEVYTGSLTTTPLGTTGTLAAVFVNQSGYDVGRSKVATVVNTPDGTTALVVDLQTRAIVHEAQVQAGRLDLTSFDTQGRYRIVCNGVVSPAFYVGKFWNQAVSAGPSLGFMNDARQDTFKTGASTGYAWRDSHQFSFEMHALVARYCANPAAYDRLPYGIIELATSEYPELRTQAEPDIVWLMKFAATRYVDLAVNDGVQLHALIKGQLPFFLWLYPHISQWVSPTLYQAVRDVAVGQWATTTTNLSWYDTGSSNDMFATQSVVGDAKGAEPPGHKILPNLLMWQVAQRDGLATPHAYLDAAVANAAWLVARDPANPADHKGQRMSEHVTLTGLCHLLEAYPEHAPAGTVAWVQAWAEKQVARSGNMWDFRMYSATAAGDATDRWTNTLGYNEPGSVAGLPAALLAARRVLTGPTLRASLRRLAQAQFDQVFGRNPYRRHYCHTAPQEFDGVEFGYASRHPAGFGDLSGSRGILDGAPKENAYPYAPSASDSHVEGWVAFNTAWDHALAYDAADDVTLDVLNASGSPVTSATVGQALTIRLRAPLNFNPTAAEAGQVLVAVNGAAPSQVTVTEDGPDGWYFEGTYSPSASGSVVVSYGYGLFRRTRTVTVL